MVREGPFEYRPRQVRKGTSCLDGTVGEGHSQCQGPEAGTFLVHLKNREAVQRGGEEAAGLGQQELRVPGQRVAVHSRRTSGLWRVLSRK